MAKAKYKPLKDILSVDTALIQASSLLDIAAQRAIDDGDIRSMKKVAHSWLEMSAVMHQLSQPEEEEMEEHEVVSTTQIGFVGQTMEVEPDVEWEEEEPEFKGTGFQIGFRGNE